MRWASRRKRGHKEHAPRARRVRLARITFTCTAARSAGLPYAASVAAKPQPVVLDVAGHDVTVTNPDKVYFPEAGITKIEVVRYYLAVAEGALKHAGGRPNVLVRYANGIHGEFFYQKRAPEKRPEFVEVVALSFPSGRIAEEVVPAERGGAGLDGQPGLPGASSAPRARGPPGASRRAARRPRSRARASNGRSSRRSHGPFARSWTITASSAGPRRRAPAASMSTSASIRAGRSTRSAAARWPSRARSSAARPRSRPASGGRRSGTACSSTTTRTRRTARSAARTRSGPSPTRASPRR